MTATREIETRDLWAAFRGCEMASLTLAELEELARVHEGITLFASRVIAEAARQAIAGRLHRKDEAS